MSNYIIGIDGGGTKTLGVLFDLAGNEIKRHQVGFSNFSIDEEKAKENIINLLKHLTAKLKKSSKAFVQLGIAGTSKLSNPQQFLNQIETEFNCRADLKTDAYIALQAVKRKEALPVILAIGGTGSVIMTDYGEKINMIGGWGHILGDYGSAYHLVIEAIKNIISEFENQKKLSLLSKHLLKIMNIESNRYKITEYVYNKDKSSLAKLSKEIQKIAIDDSYAKSLLIKEGNWLAEQIINAYKLYIKKGPVLVALRGSFALKALYVKETIIEKVNENIKDVHFDIDGPEPVYGAYIQAKKYLLREI